MMSMVVEVRTPEVIYRRSRERGRMMPDGLKFVSTLTAFRPGIGAFDFRDPHFVMRIPSLLADLLGNRMPAVLFPGFDRRFIFEIGDGDSQAVRSARTLGSDATRLL